MGILKKPIKVGVLTSLLLTPAALANAQEIQPHQKTEQIAYVNAVAVETKEQLQTMYKNLTDKSSLDDITIAESRFSGLSAAGFTVDEIQFIKAKVAYVRAQKTLLTEIKSLGESINKLTYTSSSLIRDAEATEDKYKEFMNEAKAGSYANVQKTFKEAVNTAPQTAISSMLGLAVQYGYDEAGQKNYFKTNGADLDKLTTMVNAVATVQPTIDLLDDFKLELSKSDPDFTIVKDTVSAITTAYNALSADHKKIVIAYIPKDETIAPYKTYTDTKQNIDAALKVEESITQLIGKDAASFDKATTFISAVSAIETAYGKLTKEAQNYITNYNAFSPYKAAADVSKQINTLVVSNSADYRAIVNNLTLSYNGLDKKAFVKNAANLTAAQEEIVEATKIEALIQGIENAGAAEQFTKIKDAREAYNTPPSTVNAANVKKIVNNLSTLIDWEKKYSASTDVDKLIAAIDPNLSTFESKTLLAQSAFDKLSTTEQAIVQNKAQLATYFPYADLMNKVNALKTTSPDYSQQIMAYQTKVNALDPTGHAQEAALNTIKTKLSEKLTLLSNENAALADVVSKISALTSSQNLIQDMQEARKQYDALSTDAKKRVTNIKILTDLEKSQKAVLNVITLVEKLDPAAKDYTKKAKAANTAYLKLDATNKSYVKNYKTLKDQVEAMGIITRIMALSTSQKTYNETVDLLLNDYAALSDAAKQLVTNYQDLQTAKGYMTTAKSFDDRVIALANEPDTTFVAKVAALTAEYKTMDKNAKKLVAQYKTLTAYEKNNASVVKVINLITALNPSSKDYSKKVLAARKAYNALDPASQKRVTNYDQLATVEDVATLIGLIETLKPTSKTFLNDLDTARKNYDALSPEKQSAVINYEKLVTAETELKFAHTVIALIEAAVPDDEEFLTKLMNARVAYDKLPSGQKKLVSNVKVLTDREKQVKPILNTMVQIDVLEPGSSKFVSQVNSARKAYDKLTKEQKAYVKNIAILQGYEPTAKVIELIGKLKASSKTFHTDTAQARALYDGLSQEMQQYVANYHLLQAAETSILGAGNVQRMIEELPSVEASQYVKRIEEIRAAYNALPKDQQMAVENYKTLQEQEKLIKPVINVVNEIEKLMTSKNMDSQYQKILKAYDNLNATQRRYVYNQQLLLSLDNVIKVYQSIADLKPSDPLYFGKVESVRKDYDSLNTIDKQRVSNYNILLEAEKNLTDVKKVVEIIGGLHPTSSTYIEDVANAVAVYKALDSKVRGQVINYDTLKKAEKDVAAVLKVVNAIGEIDPDNKQFEKKVLAAQKSYSSLSLEQQDLVYNFRILQDHLRALGLE